MGHIEAGAGIITSRDAPRKGENIGHPAHIAVVGIAGNIGQSLLRYGSGVEFTGLSNRTLPRQADRLRESIHGFDVTNRDAVLRHVEHLARNGVRTIINAAGDVNTDPVELQRRDPKRRFLGAYQTNVAGAIHLAEAAKANGVGLMYLSTKVVVPFDTESGYPEQLLPDYFLDISDTDTMRAPTWYGLTKALGEREVLRRHPEGATVVRLENVHGPNGGLFAATARNLMREASFSRVDDMYGGHLTDQTVINGILAIEAGMHDPDRQDTLSKVYHLAASTLMTPYQIALAMAEQLAVSPDLVSPMHQAALIEQNQGNPAPVVYRPGRAFLNSERFTQDFGPLPSAEAEVTKYLALYRKTIRDTL